MVVEVGRQCVQRVRQSGILKGFSWLGLGDGSKGMELRIGHVVSGCVHMRVVAGRQVCK